MKKTVVKMYVENGLRTAIKGHEKTIEKLRKSKNRYKDQLMEFYQNAKKKVEKDLEELMENFTVEED